MTAPISLNGNRYLLRNFDSGEYVRRTQEQQFAEVQRADGRRTRDQIQSFNTIGWPNLSLGHGRERICADSAGNIAEFRRFWDSTSVTWHAHSVALGLADTAATSTGLERIGPGSAIFKGALWALWSDDTSTDIVARTYNTSTDTWEGGGAVRASATTNIPLDLIESNGNLVALFAEANDLYVAISSDGVTWNLATTGSGIIGSNYLANNVTADELASFGMLARSANEVIAVLWHEANGTITFATSTDGGDNWTDEAVDIPDTGGPKGAQAYPDIDGIEKLYVATRDGVWLSDISVATWTIDLILGMSPAGGNGNRMALHQGSLWIPVDNGDDAPFGLWSLTVQGDNRIINTKLGLDVTDGLPSDALGTISYLQPAGEYLFAAIGGEVAGKNARLMLHNGKGWHTVNKCGTENDLILWIGQMIEGKVIWAVRESGSTYTSYYIDNVLVPPASGPTNVYETTSYVDLPYVDAGLPLHSKAFLRVGVNALDLSADNTGEYINVDYGEDDGTGGLNARNNTDLGDILSGTKTLDWASGAGLSSVNMGLRVNLLRDGGDTSQTPLLKDVEINHLPHIAVLEQFEVVVDIAASAEQDGKSTEDIIEQLEAARDSVILVAADMPGEFAATFVNVAQLAFVEGFDSTAGPDPLVGSDPHARRNGFARLVLKEIVR